MKSLTREYCLDVIMFTIGTLTEGLPYEMVRNACPLTEEYKSRILVSVTVFMAEAPHELISLFWSPLVI